jgi:electron transfer flavoprotein beta subunit
MEIVVCVKQVPDTETRVVPRSDGTYIETASIKWIMNPYDEFAVEQALLVKASNPSANVTVVRVGSVQSSEALRTALAMGADEAILVEAADNLDSCQIVKAIKNALEKSGKKPNLILSGKQAIDSDCLQVPQMLAQSLGMPSVSVVVGFEMTGDKLILKREVDGGAIEIYEVALPAVVACNKGLNTPRYASLPGIMKAKKKPLAQYSMADVGVSESDRKLHYSDFRLPPEKPQGKVFDAMEEAKHRDVVKQVVSLLRNEAKIL